MSLSIDCKRARRRLADLAEGSVEADIRDHFGTCPVCAEESKAFRAVLEAASDLSERDAPDPGEAYWDSFLPRVRARIALRGRRSARSLWRAVAAAAALIVAGSAGLLLLPGPAGRRGGGAGTATPELSEEAASLLLEEVLGNHPEVSPEVASDPIGADLAPEIGPQEILEAMREMERPPGLAGAWADEEVQRLLDSLDARQAAQLRAELAAERT